MHCWLLGGEEEREKEVGRHVFIIKTSQHELANPGPYIPDLCTVSWSVEANSVNDIRVVCKHVTRWPDRQTVRAQEHPAGAVLKNLMSAWA